MLTTQDDRTDDAPKSVAASFVQSDMSLPVMYPSPDSAVEKPLNGRHWLSEIERLKGFTIVLVVWAHVYDAQFADWALDLRHAIYAFHMPLFMFFSGYIFVYVGAHQLKGSMSRYVTKRAQRLLIPFFVMATLVIVGKLLAGRVMAVDKPVNDIAESFYNVFFNTEGSPVQFIWYLIVLFYLSVATAFLFSRLKISLAALFVASIVMHIAHVTLFYRGIVLDFLYFNRVLMYYVFFMTGCIACLRRDIWLPLIDKFWPVALLIFMVFEYFLFDSEWRYLFVGAVSMVLFHGMTRRLLDGNKFMEFLGRNAFVIYLFNVLFIGLVKGIFGKFVALPADNALIVIVLSTIVAVACPILIKNALSRFNSMKRVVAAME